LNTPPDHPYGLGYNYLLVARTVEKRVYDAMLGKFSAYRLHSLAEALNVEINRIFFVFSALCRDLLVF